MSFHNNLNYINFLGSLYGSYPYLPTPLPQHSGHPLHSSAPHLALVQDMFFQARPTLVSSSVPFISYPLPAMSSSLSGSVLSPLAFQMMPSVVPMLPGSAIPSSLSSTVATVAAVANAVSSEMSSSTNSSLVSISSGTSGSGVLPSAYGVTTSSSVSTSLESTIPSSSSSSTATMIGSPLVPASMSLSTTSMSSTKATSPFSEIYHQFEKVYALPSTLNKAICANPLCSNGKMKKKNFCTSCAQSCSISKEYLGVVSYSPNVNTFLPKFYYALKGTNEIILIFSHPKYLELTVLHGFDIKKYNEKDTLSFHWCKGCKKIAIQGLWQEGRKMCCVLNNIKKDTRRAAYSSHKSTPATSTNDLSSSSLSSPLSSSSSSSSSSSCDRFSRAVTTHCSNDDASAERGDVSTSSSSSTRKTTRDSSSISTPTTTKKAKS